jgi:hypothetical protein
MKPAQGRAGKLGWAPTLGESDDPWIVFICDKCGRRGEYKRETLLAAFGPDIAMPSLLQPFAIKAGCVLAQMDTHKLYGAPAECKIHYDVELPD